MKMISKTTLGIAAGLCGTLFVGYCIYFDRQRRNAPDFKKKLRERRKANKVSKQATTTKFPDLNNHEAVQSFFLNQIQLGEEALSQGHVSVGIDHLSNAVAVCGQPNQLLQVLQQTLPPQVFHMLLQRLPAVSQRLSQNPCSQMVDEDVE